MWYGAIIRIGDMMNSLFGVLTNQVLSLLTDLAQVFWVSVMDATVFLKIAEQLKEHNYNA